MVYSLIRRFPFDQHWFNLTLYSNPEYFTKLLAKKTFFQHKSLELSIGYGVFTCLKNTELIIDTIDYSNYHISVVFLTTINQQIFEIFEGYSPELSTRYRDTKIVRGKLIKLNPNIQYKYLVLSYNSPFYEDIEPKESSISPETKDLIRSLHTEFNREARNSVILNLCDRILESIATIHTKPLDNSLPPSNFEELIQQSFREKVFNYSEFLIRYNIDEKNINKYTKLKYSQSLRQYFTFKKIEFGYELILESNYSIEQAAITIGYQSVPYFSTQVIRFKGRKAIRELKTRQLKNPPIYKIE